MDRSFASAGDGRAPVRRRRRIVTWTFVALGAAVAIVVATSGPDVFARPRAIADFLPADPMIAGVYTVHPAEKLDVWLERLEKLTGETIDPWAELDAKLGLSFRDDVLGAFGPEFAFALDLPPRDPHGEPFQTLGRQMPARLLEGLVLVTRIRDKASATRALTALSDLADAELEADGDRITVTLRDPSRGGGTLTLHARIRRDLLILSGSPERIDAAMAGNARGSLANGADFALVATHVQADADTLTYFNLPKIRGWIRDSGLMTMTAGNRMEAFLADEFMGMGWIHTTRDVGDGVEVATFGPEAAAGGLWAMWTGAYLLPLRMAPLLGGLAAGNEHGASEQAMAEVRSIATALEAYAIDRAQYPPTDGWETAADLRRYLQPAYIRQLPDADPWGRPYLVWSDGNSYRIVSGGRDRTTEREWAGEVAQGSSDDAATDIVFGDGAFLRWHAR